MTDAFLKASITLPCADGIRTRIPVPRSSAVELLRCPVPRARPLGGIRTRAVRPF